MSKFLIRKAAEHEAALLSALAFRSKAYWTYPEAFMEACRSELSYSSKDLRRHLFYVAEAAGSVVGFYALIELSAQEMELEALFVEPEHIGHGYGRRLIEHAKATARVLGPSSLIIQGDPNAETFYLAAGGKRTGERESGSIAGRYLPVFTINLFDTATSIAQASLKQ